MPARSRSLQNRFEIHGAAARHKNASEKRQPTFLLSYRNAHKYTEQPSSPPRLETHAGKQASPPTVAAHRYTTHTYKAQPRQEPVSQHSIGLSKHGSHPARRDDTTDGDTDRTAALAATIQRSSCSTLARREPCGRHTSPAKESVTRLCCVAQTRHAQHVAIRETSEAAQPAVEVAGVKAALV